MKVTNPPAPLIPGAKLRLQWPLLERSNKLGTPFAERYLDPLLYLEMERAAQPIDSPAKFGNAPLLGVPLNFRCFQDVLNATPTRFRSLPVYLTETNHLFPVNESQFGWLDDNRGWAWKMYQAVNAWNAAGNQQIHAALLYRWPNFDEWGIVDKPRVVEDFRQAVELGYRPYAKHV